MRVYTSKDNGHSNEPFWNCFIFHDVDMIPEDERLYYTCNENNPVHFAVAVRKFSYQVDGYYSQYYGGIISYTYEQYVTINGFSNLYFGWGAEDDDLGRRTSLKYPRIEKLPADISRIYTDDHAPESRNPKRIEILMKTANLFNGTDALEGLSTTKYELLSVTKNYLFTKILVDYNKTELLDDANRYLKMLNKTDFFEYY